MTMAGKNIKKGMNTNSNTYIIIYSIILVLIVAFVMAFVSQTLKPMQDVNVALDKKKQILAALNIRDLDDEASASKYAEVVVADEVLSSDGKVVEQGTKGGEKAGFVLNSADYKAGRLALFVCSIDGQTKYVVPVYGMGLWGPIWGYVAIDADKNTVYGAYFNHESETAGLGAEIKDSRTWQEQFRGKKIFSEEDDNVSLSVVKKNNVKNPASECDAITGATLTSVGVSDMLQEGLEAYKAFLKTKD